MLAKTQLTQAVKAEARRQGFALVGVTTPASPPHLDVYESWLAQGHHAGMDWIATERARQRRADARLILPECQSVLVLGVGYKPSFHPPAPSLLPKLGEGRGSKVSPPFMGGTEGGACGQIAAYARGQDYHDALPPRLKAIVKFIETTVGHSVPNRWYTDTGPILERELAQRAGLGWIGKNGNLIHPGQGSTFLLAEIFLGVELIPDAPFARDHCGTCTRCLDACPTACILPDRTVDSNRCVSYLTIEHKGFISPELRLKLGNWIFGCDSCQQVCPWNKPLLPTPLPVGEGKGGFDASSNLIAELALTPQEFNRKFKGTPVKRTRRRGYLRNVAIVLGNRGNADAIPALIEALSDVEPLIRGHAAWALGEIGSDAARNALKSAAERETDPDVLAEIKLALSLMA